MTHVTSPLATVRSHATRLRSGKLAALGVGLLCSVLPFMTAAATAETAPHSNLRDGVHAFGESRESGQLGQTYMVTEVTDGRIVGGFYQPSSSFDCFYGQVEGNAMVLTVVDSYQQTEYPYAMTLAASESVAGPGVRIAPTGFYALAEMSDTDRNVLQVCKNQI